MKFTIVHADAVAVRIAAMGKIHLTSFLRSTIANLGIRIRELLGHEDEGEQELLQKDKRVFEELLNYLNVEEKRLDKLEPDGKFISWKTTTPMNNSENQLNKFLILESTRGC